MSAARAGDGTSATRTVPPPAGGAETERPEMPGWAGLGGEMSIQLSIMTGRYVYV